MVLEKNVGPRSRLTPALARLVDGLPEDVLLVFKIAAPCDTAACHDTLTKGVCLNQRRASQEFADPFRLCPLA
jgi:hypothetical protein